MENFVIKSNQHHLYGVIHEVTNSVNPIVLIVHGYFSSNRIGYNRLYYDIANELSVNGYMTVRCDLSGMGESEGNLKDISFEAHVNDVLNITRYLYEKYNKKVFLIGHSIGSLLALHSYKVVPEYYEKIILISPLFFNMTILLRFFESKMIEELKSVGYTCRKGISVNYSFFNRRMSLLSVASEINNCKIPIRLIIGDADLFFQCREIVRLCNAIDALPVILSKGDHNFSDKPTRELLSKSILEFLNG